LLRPVVDLTSTYRPLLRRTNEDFSAEALDILGQLRVLSIQFDKAFMSM
jgi:hypothetical protein